MATLTGTQLAEGIRKKLDELKKACGEVDENTAGRAPAGRWSPKEIISHLLGPEESGHLPIFQAFLNKDAPTIEIDPGNPFFSGKRAQMTFAQLLSEVEKEYERMAVFAGGLSGEQLARKAHVPRLKESPLGENPTLELMVKGLGQYHIQMHIDQMHEILQELKDS
jgi:hypothetical protein